MPRLAKIYKKAQQIGSMKTTMGILREFVMYLFIWAMGGRPFRPLGRSLRLIASQRRSASGRRTMSSCTHMTFTNRSRHCYPEAGKAIDRKIFAAGKHANRTR